MRLQREVVLHEHRRYNDLAAMLRVMRVMDPEAYDEVSARLSTLLAGNFF
jgi:hypothetical protein